MIFRVRYTRGARDDLKRLHAALLDGDSATAAPALEAIRRAVELVAHSPFACRRADDTDPFLRELVIPFADTGYVALFDIEGVRPAADPACGYVALLAIRTLREDDYL